MLATVKVDYEYSGPKEAGGGVVIGVVDIRSTPLIGGVGGTTLEKILMKARVLEGNRPMHEHLPIGCREMNHKFGTIVFLDSSVLPKRKGESFVHKYKKHYHRGTKSTNNMVVTIEPLSIPRLA